MRMLLASLLLVCLCLNCQAEIQPTPDDTFAATTISTTATAIISQPTDTITQANANPNTDTIVATHTPVDASTAAAFLVPATAPECLEYNTLWGPTVTDNLARFSQNGITEDLLEAAAKHATEQDGGWRVLLHKGKLYAQPLGLMLKEHGERQLRGKLHESVVFMLKSQCMGSIPEGVEFVYRNGDHGIVGPGNPVPIFSWSRDSSDQNDILFPYVISLTYPRRWSRTFDHVPWEKKKSIAFWRGATTGGLFTEDNWRDMPRSQLVQLCTSQPDLCSASITSFVQITPGAKRQMKAELGKGADSESAVPFSHFSRYRYSLLIDGNSAPSSRFAPLLFSGTALLKQDSPSYEFFYPLLRPGEHYLPVARNLSDLLDQIRWAQEHDDKMQQMAQNANEWAQRMLSDVSISCYVQQLLSSYRGLMRYTPEPSQALLDWEVKPCDKVTNTVEKYLGRQCASLHGTGDDEAATEEDAPIEY